jgi:hypothetical protein
VVQILPAGQIVPGDAKTATNDIKLYVKLYGKYKSAMGKALGK